MKTCDQRTQALLDSVKEAKPHLTFDRMAHKFVSVVLTLEQHSYLVQLLQQLNETSKETGT